MRFFSQKSGFFISDLKNLRPFSVASYKKALFPGYLFWGLEELTPFFMISIKKNKWISQVFEG